MFVHNFQQLSVELLNLTEIFSLKANGFQGAKGPAGGIPAAYTLIAKHFYKKLLKANQHHRFKLLEYSKPGWTYHAKGLW